VNIGNNVTIGHGAILTSCIVKSDTLIGQGAIVGAGAEVGRHCVIAAGAVILPDTLIPDKELWAGNPAKKIRAVTDEEIEGLKKSAEVYHELAQQHSEEFLPVGTLYQEAEKKGHL
jgi:carbonic anhydrase/acetyltransferase-like protein (isoleucine patch superfamily)